jgi:glucose/arabinose dehydrogenase
VLLLISHFAPLVCLLAPCVCVIVCVCVLNHCYSHRVAQVQYAILSPQLGDVESVEPLLTGFASNNFLSRNCGRPVDTLLLADGSILVSDDHSDQVYRITRR